MNKHQLEELKNMISHLNLNNEFDNLEAEGCSVCCVTSSGGVSDTLSPYPL